MLLTTCGVALLASILVGHFLYARSKRFNLLLLARESRSLRPVLTIRTERSAFCFGPKLFLPVLIGLTKTGGSSNNRVTVKLLQSKRIATTP
ncbi:MAG: hypothetical protein DMF36_06155 [Verrucomicrobia bacterium]|nr:MAG: hypothetical protein AUH08_04150 [Verrucomicrobia bacterium 13_2_20CM_54_12]OLD87854.1 MAG: hypothetical protein AUG81_08005 [Verrucomicrobia bacterium 13_1_20CM_4_54_11]OLE12594.1 MAG: hypothetical protein AUG52_03290 [Verrucomicrobia bacterium 13_1_20CM_3_54_17]PYK16138.1 MAG: hypothetical protein DME64_04375 [Verrucomicrobiota bacterium]PYL39121.1 MAG: hypothetical protein DMF36_06155 [Verrucomicrobiota bacterium]